MARPVKDLDKNQIEQLAMIQCTMGEIAAVMSCSVDTLDRRYAEVIKQGRQKGAMSLRRMQYERARSGNTAMLIWLGKQYLGQTEKMVMQTEERDFVWDTGDPNAGSQAPA